MEYSTKFSDFKPEEAFQLSTELANKKAIKKLKEEIYYKLDVLELSKLEKIIKIINS